jgi:hypothetical protein
MQGMGQSMEGMANRYAQLGLSGVGATPGSAGGRAGGIGVGNIGQNINFPQLPTGMAQGGIQFPPGGGLGASGSGLPGSFSGAGSPLVSGGGSPGFGLPGGGGATTNFPGSPGGGSLPSFAGGSGTPGGVSASVPDMPTAERMDLGFAPSLTGGIPNEFAALLGELQTQDIAQTLSMSQGGGQSGGGGKGGGGKGGLGSIGSLAMMGGK